MGAFFECTALKRILLPDTLVTINRSAFEGCISLESINIPDSVQRGFLTLDQAFVNCPALKEVHISEQQLKSLGFLSPKIFEKEETDGDFSTYYIDKNCGPWYLNLKHIEIETAKRQDDWRKSGLCQYCGAKFEGGFFSIKKCSYCGKPKDY